ncbi:MAG TPA: GvpL/GvpF family gas vesicle protein [Gemmatimonadaceae bacterium]|nr:GvpL/GvpF family gas vesicle protein [Gemmatimonadaceae bacterium]
MPTYLYCVIPAGCDPPAASRVGVDAASVRSLDAAGMSAWVSSVADPSLTPSVARARAHDQVVRDAMARATPVPARFGQVLADDAALAQWIADRRQSLLDSLARVSGCVEMTVRILLASREASPGQAPRESGSAYMRWVRERQQARQSVTDQAEFLRTSVARAVEEAGVVREEKWAAVTPGARSLEAAHLVPRESIARHREVVRAAVERDHRMKVMLSGPWAPYTFCAAGHE